MINSSQIESASRWLSEQAKKYSYAEISIKLIIHNNQIKRIERSLVEKVQEI
jgi:hypothetical protein